MVGGLGWNRSQRVLSYLEEKAGNNLKAEGMETMI